MLKTAIFSDVHANLTALKAVIADAKEQGAQNFACLGDVVGYGPDPIDCVALIQEIGCVCVKGNHDEDSSNERVLSNLNDEARHSLEWTRGRLSQSQKRWLSDLPYKRRLGRNMLVHATLDSPEYWDYTRNKFDATVALSNQSAPVCFFGHTHAPVAYEYQNGRVNALHQEEIDLHSKRKYLVNVGSVGQPRDGIPDACYVLFDRAKRTITYRRVNYDVSSVVEGINSVGLLPSLGERLIVAA